MIDIFTLDMFRTVELTAAVRRLPNKFNRFAQLGLFPARGVRTRSVSIEELNETFNLLPTKPWGSPGTTGKTDKRSGYAFSIPHIPHDDAVDPGDVQGVRDFGSEEGLKTIAAATTAKLAKMRDATDATVEYMRATALTGTLKNGAGTTLYDYYSVFGIQKKSTDFVFGTSTTDIVSKCLEVKRYIEGNLRGATMTSVYCLCSSGFYDKLTGHANVKDAFKYFQTNQPAGGDYRSGFRYGNIVFEEYTGTFTLADGNTSGPLLTANEALFFPIGAEIGATLYAPADFNETVNTLGMDYYAKAEPRKFGRGVDLHVQSNPLPILLRPDLVVRGHTSN